MRLSAHITESPFLLFLGAGASVPLGKPVMATFFQNASKHCPQNPLLQTLLALKGSLGPRSDFPRAAIPCSSGLHFRFKFAIGAPSRSARPSPLRGTSYIFGNDIKTRDAVELLRWLKRRGERGQPDLRPVFRIAYRSSSEVQAGWRLDLRSTRSLTAQQERLGVLTFSADLE